MFCYYCWCTTCSHGATGLEQDFLVEGLDFLVSRFLFDVHCPDYKYYEHKLAQEELALQVESSAATGNGSTVDFSMLTVER